MEDAANVTASTAQDFRNAVFYFCVLSISRSGIAESRMVVPERISGADHGTKAKILRQ